MSSQHIAARNVGVYNSRLIPKLRGGIIALLLITPLLVLLGMSRFPAHGSGFGGYERATASIAYGSLNNFDCVNDTGVEAHGFEIELDDIRCSDISYTYDYNHYGVPSIREDLSDPVHPRVFVRYASAKLPDGSWAAYTAIPSGPISPTDGHQFTDPSINFGGEHFGVGYNANPTAVKYNWLIDDGSGNLVHGPPVDVATPTFTYYPPVGGAAANVVAAIVPPPPPAPPVLRFGAATWVKSIKTTTHNANKVRLQDLVSDDPGMPEPWANGEPDEVEVEWKLLQTEFAAPDGGVNGELQGAPEELPDGDEIITRRYEFFKYLGPIDGESGEAMADAVGPDGIHGVGTVTYNSYFDPLTGEWVQETVDLSTIEVVGEFFGAQMSGFDVAPLLGMIDNIQDGILNEQFPDRSVVIAGGFPFVANLTSGNLPPGMSLDAYSGVLSGTPTLVGAYTFTIEASDTSQRHVTHTYTLTVVSDVNPGTYNITTAALPAQGGSTIGGGTYNSGDEVTVIATPNAGYYFQYWSEGDVHFSFTPSYTFTVSASRDLVANFLVDNVAPITVHSLAGPLGNNGWYTGPVEVSLTATDPESGVSTTWYRLDGGGQIPYLDPFIIGLDGAHNIAYWSEDKAANVEAAHSMAVNIDGALPILTAIANPAVVGPTSGKMAAVRVSGTIIDGVSGVDSTKGTFATHDSEGRFEPSGSFGIGADGRFSFTVLLEARVVKRSTVARIYTVSLRARDIAGNIGTKAVTVRVPAK